MVGFDGEAAGPLCVAFSPNSKWLAAGGLERQGDSLAGVVQVWDTATGKHQFTLRGNKLPVGMIAFSPTAAC